MARLTREEQLARAEAGFQELLAISRRMRQAREAEAAEPAPVAAPAHYPRRCSTAKTRGRGPSARPVMCDGKKAPGIARARKARFAARLEGQRLTTDLSRK
jgi:hypothetical protein